MNLKTNKTYFNIMALAGLLSLMSCAEDIVFGTSEVPDENVITLSVTSEAQTTSPRTRAFSIGEHVNQLIYKIYKKTVNDDDDSVYAEDTYFLAGKTYQIDDEDSITNCGVINGYDPTKQTTIRLIPNPDDTEGQEYKIVCWAQKEDSPYFNLREFPDKISINYGEEMDTDGSIICETNVEERDAFYCSTTFKVSDKGTNVPIILRRPFAQINIGTSGWDYEGFAIIEPLQKIIRYSTIKVDGIATSFSPFDNKCEAKDLTTVTFDWTKLPAYVHLNLESPVTEDDITGVYATDHRETENPDSLGVFPKNIAEEEFLTLLLPKHENSSTEEDTESEETALANDETSTNGDNKNSKDYEDDSATGHQYSPYIGWKRYDNFCATTSSHEELIDSIFTETFKYLSMCYVLVPFEVEIDEKGNETRTANSTVNIAFDCAVKKPADNKSWENVLGKDKNGKDKNVLALNNVPVGSNRRTNIVAADGTGFFMNSNELKVAVYSETFGEYYKRLDATDEAWTDGDKDGDRLNDGEDGFDWPDDDIDPEAGKFPMEKPNITMALRNDDQYFSPEENTIKVFVYIDRDKDKSFDDARNADKEEVSFKVNALNINSDRYDFEFYLGEQKIEVTPNSSGDCTIKKSVTELISIIKNNNITKVTDVSDEEVQIPYYPITCTVKTVPKRENYKAPDDQTVTIKVYPIYEKYTFSFDSDDEGKSIMEWIKEYGTDADSDPTKDTYEKGFKSIGGNTVVSTSTISVQGRAGGTTGNHRLFAMSDHLEFKGAGGFTSSDAYGKSANNIGHYVTLKDLAGSSKITVKVGRDQKQDNSSKTASQTTPDYNDRRLKFQYPNGNIAYGETWMALRLPNANAVADDGTMPDETTNTTSRYRVSETKIAKGYDVELSNPGDVKISMDKSGFCFYWIIISETDDDMLESNY